MPARADVVVGTAVNAHFDGAGENHTIETPAGVLYQVFVNANTDVVFKRSDDGGLSWGLEVSVFAGTVTALAVWYDRWSNISAGLIHIAYQESVTDDTLYRTINTESGDALSTQTVIFAGASTAAGGCLSIARSVGGNVYCATMIDAGTEGGFFRLPNANVPNGAWDAARTTVFEGATQDMVLLAPDFDAADTQDIMAIFWDASANEISRKLYDDSANTWGETSIATGMTDAGTAGNVPYPHFNLAVDIANTQIVLVAWSAVDLANADLRCWTVDAGAISEVTNVVLNSADDQGLAAICIDPARGVWWVFYAGASGGGETFRTAVNIYCKASNDGGSTWGPETQITASARDIPWLSCQPVRYIHRPAVSYFHNGSTTDEIKCCVDITQPRAAFQLFGG